MIRQKVQQTANACSSVSAQRKKARSNLYPTALGRGKREPLNLIKKQNERRANEFQWFVEGTPITKGSFNFFRKGNRVIVRPADKRLDAWEENIRLAATEAVAGAPPSERGWIIRLKFFLRRPKTVKRIDPTTKPDLDKLVRAVLDPLTGVVYNDDSQVIDIHARKYYVDDEMSLRKETGVEIDLTELE